jgi:carbon monoxide dehydrogenase subunit G
MGRRKLTMAMLVVVPLGLSSLACGDDRDRQALADDELERDLDLAFQRDTVAPTFEDVGVEAEPDAPPAQATPPQTPRAQPPQQQPRPTQPGQPAPTTPQPRTVTLSVPSGTTLAIRMNDELSTERSQAGDAFTAVLTAPLVDAAGIVLVPAGATVRGRVTAVAPSTRVGQTATMNLAFESISFGGQSHPLHATVERADVQQKTRTSTAEQAGKIAAGTAAGAILGQVIGRDRSSTIRGAAVGAAAGTAIAMGTADVDAVLPAGAEVVIRLDQPIQVTRTVTS